MLPASRRGPPGCPRQDCCTLDLPTRLTAKVTPISDAYSKPTCRKRRSRRSQNLIRAHLLSPYLRQTHNTPIFTTSCSPEEPTAISRLNLWPSVNFRPCFTTRGP